MNNVNRGAVLAVVLVLAAIVAVVAYNAGVAQGVAQAGRLAAPPAAGPYPYPYYAWSPLAGVGLLIPLAFIAFWLLVARGFFWRGGCARHYRGGPVEPGQTASR